MRKETDLEAVKEILIDFLSVRAQKTPSDEITIFLVM